MSASPESSGRLVAAVHGLRQVRADSDYEIGLAEHLRSTRTRDGLLDLFARFAPGDGDFDVMMRRILFRALARRVGNGLHVGNGVGFKHLETFEFGDGVFIGAQAYLQGRFDGQCVIGNGVWLGPQSYFDARDLMLGDFVGWGPGAKVLGSEHNGLPVNVPIIRTDLVIRPVRIGAWADIGTNAVILPGVTVGRGSIIGAGAVVTTDVLPFSIVAGVPARFVRWREGHIPEGAGPAGPANPDGQGACGGPAKEDPA